MDPLIIPLALGCVLTFSHVDRVMTEQNIHISDDVIYRTVSVTDSLRKKHVLEPVARGQGFSPSASFDVGRSPDGLFASYIVFMEAAGHDINEVRFISAKTCAPVNFVLVRNGLEVGAEEYAGWVPDGKHNVRAMNHLSDYEIALPYDEARVINPNIKD